jgi:Cu+-exporting ATPase
LLIRDARSLEFLASANVLVLDKTGTITEGKPALVEIRARGGASEDEVLGLAAALESRSVHPLAHAILAAAKDRGLASLELSDFASVTGQGLKATVNGTSILAGNAALLQGAGIALCAHPAEAETLRESGATVLFVARGATVIGLLAVKDRLKPQARAHIEALRASGLEIVLATGDSAITARAIAREAGIEHIEAELSPQGKSALVRTLQSRRKIVAMAGDGVNDAPALAAADVSIAMGTGADTAIEAAGITLLKGDLAGLMRARRLSRATVANMKQNLFFAFFYNAIGVPLAAGVLFPLTGWLLSPMIAAAAMSLSSVSVIANALRLKTAAL